jgi:hypothetical protein
MLHFRSVFKIAAVIFSITLILSCKDIPRDNILDPKNPNSYRAQVIALEAFVNTQNDQMYNEYMLFGLKTILERYPGKLILMQYHRNSTYFTDSLAIPENELLYEQYLENFDDLKGVPDVFINGTVDRIKGASSVEGAVERIDNAIQRLLIENSFFTIEPTVKRNNLTVSLSAKIARLGTGISSDIIVRATITERIDSGIYSRVVRYMENSNLIPRIESGAQKEIKFSDFIVNSNNDLYTVFTVTSNENIIIHQSIEVAIP